MPDIVIIDLAAVLDASKVGQAATKSLEKAWAVAKNEPEAKRGAALVRIEERRDALRKALLERAKPVVAKKAKERGAKVVLERASVVWADGSVSDLTSEVIQEVDHGGPLVAR